MEKVLPILSVLSPKDAVRGIQLDRIARGGAIIEKIAGPGKYLISLKDGTKLSAVGPEGLEPGARVKVAPFSNKPPDMAVGHDPSVRLLKGDNWLAKFPMKLESGTSEVKLEIHIEDDGPKLLGKKEKVVHLVFSIKTVTLGLIQWSVYLRQNQVLTQVYFEKAGVDQSEIGQIIREFEDSLKKKGFSLLAPTVILKRPFKVSAGLQLNVQG